MSVALENLTLVWRATQPVFVDVACLTWIKRWRVSFDGDGIFTVEIEVTSWRVLRAYSMLEQITSFG
jgi:hypothetical protein